MERRQGRRERNREQVWEEGLSMKWSGKLEVRSEGRAQKSFLCLFASRYPGCYFFSLFQAVSPLLPYLRVKHRPIPCV